MDTNYELQLYSVHIYGWTLSIRFTNHTVYDILDKKRTLPAEESLSPEHFRLIGIILIAPGFLVRIRKYGMTKQDKDCFGILNNVFPMGKNGLREIVPHCFGCPDRKRCLQTSLATKDGLNLRDGLLERSSGNGLTGWLRRWSEKKELSRLMQQKEWSKNDHRD